VEPSEAAAEAFGSLKTAFAALREDDTDAAWELAQDVFWWALGNGAGHEGPDAGYLVTLGRRVKDTEAERTLTALAMIRGVIGVEPVPEGGEVNHAHYIARQRVRDEVQKFAFGWPE
jgi:hypothetical protein